MFKFSVDFDELAGNRGEGSGEAQGEQGEAASPAGADTRGEGGSEEH